MDLGLLYLLVCYLYAIGTPTLVCLEEFAKGIFNHEDYTHDPNNANDKVFPGLEKCRLHDCAFRCYHYDRSRLSDG